MKRITEDGYKKTNREMVQEPKGSGICFGCDARWVREGAKCSLCGRLHGVKKVNKKIVVRD